MMNGELPDKRGLWSLLWEMNALACAALAFDDAGGTVPDGLIAAYGQDVSYSLN